MGVTLRDELRGTSSEVGGGRRLGCQCRSLTFSMQANRYFLKTEGRGVLWPNFWFNKC